MAAFELIVCIIAAVVLSSFLSRFIPKVSTPLVQIALGALASQLPFFPNVTLDPELFMVLFIAPLLYLEAHEIDKSELLKSGYIVAFIGNWHYAIATMVAWFRTACRMAPQVPPCRGTGARRRTWTDRRGRRIVARQGSRAYATSNQRA